MPRAKPVHKYSQEYYDLCKSAHTNPVKIKFDTKRKAQNFRVEMYQFRQALRKALLANTNSEDLQLSVLFAEGLEFAIKNRTLIIRAKRTSAARKIAEALEPTS